jgi:DNA polymerase-3 subunit gamma/tau
MLLKGLQEVRQAPSPIQAAEMILVRLAHAAELPTPEEAICTMSGDAVPVASPDAGSPPAGSPDAGSPPPQSVSAAPPPEPATEARLTGTDSSPVVVAVPEPEPVSKPAPQPEPVPAPEAVPEDAPVASNDAGKPAAAGQGGKTDATKHPLVQAVMATFPGSSIEGVREASDTDESDSD